MVKRARELPIQIDTLRLQPRVVVNDHFYDDVVKCSLQGKTDIHFVVKVISGVPEGEKSLAREADIYLALDEFQGIIIPRFCGCTESDDLEPIVETILDAVHDLYIKAGARNFVPVNVPPIDRSPQAIDSESSDVIEDRVTTWNHLLQAQTTEFGASSTEATVLLFSSHQVLMDVLEDPSEFDFGEDDPTMGGGIWEDDLHLTTDVHDILAERFFESVISYKT